MNISCASVSGCRSGTIRLLWACAVGMVAVGPPSSAALAADVPSGTGTKSVLKVGPAGVEGLFERKGDSDWYRISLKGGQNYAVHNGPTFEGCSILNLRDAGGKVIRTSEFGSPYSDDGFEFRPAKNGSFFVELKDAVCPDPKYPADYSADVTADARADKTTAATIAVGQTRKGLFNYGTDIDYYRTTLQAGKSYSATLETNLGERSLGLADSRGTIVFDENQPSGPVLFTVPASGTYYLIAAVQDDNAKNPYTLRLIPVNG